jgi:hypothetical protein
VDRVGGFHSRLSMEFGRVRDLEENVLHDVRSVLLLELKLLALRMFQYLL